MELKPPQPQKKAIPDTRNTFRAVLNAIYTEYRILTNTLINIENLFLETNATRSEIDFISPEDFFDKKIEPLRQDFKKFVKKFIDNTLVSSLSKSCKDPKTFKKIANEKSKEVRTKYKNMIKKFFIPKEILDKDIYQQSLQLLGENEKLGIFDHASYLSSIHPSIKEGPSVFSEKDADLMKMKRDLEGIESSSSEDDELEGFMDRSIAENNSSSIKVKPSKTEERFYKKKEDRGETRSLRESFNDSSESIKINEVEHVKDEVDFKGLPKSINVRRKNMKIEKFESGIETGNLFILFFLRKFLFSFFS